MAKDVIVAGPYPGTQRTPQYLWDRASEADKQARADHQTTVLAARKALLVAMGMVAA